MKPNPIDSPPGGLKRVVMQRGKDTILGSAARWVAGTRLAAATDGVSTIEFALIASMLATLAVGLLDLGMGLWQQMEVGNAARAGAEYAAVHGWGVDGSAIQTAATSATSLGSVSATPSQVCGCPNATSGVTWTGQSPPCTTTCADGSSPNNYISVSTRASYALVVPFPGVNSPISLTASAVARM